MDSSLLRESAASASASGEQPLPSGRSVLVKVGDDCEQLEVRSPSGDVEVRIILTGQGAVVSLHGGRLELASPDTVALRCRHLEINTAEGTDILAGGDIRIAGQEMRVKTDSDIHMNGRIIHLNC